MARLDHHRIMVVEDEYYLAADLSRTLECEGASIVGPFGTQEQALEAARQGEVDCAVLDVNLGEGPCFTLADELRARGISFLFFTGFDRGALPERFADVVRLQKPVGEARLVQEIEDVCARANARRPIRQERGL